MFIHECNRHLMFMFTNGLFLTLRPAQAAGRWGQKKVAFRPLHQADLACMVRDGLS